MNTNRIKLKNFVVDMAKIRHINIDSFAHQIGLRSYEELDKFLLQKSMKDLKPFISSMAFVLQTSTDNLENILYRGNFEALTRAEDILQMSKHKNNNSKSKHSKPNHRNRNSNKKRNFIERVREKHGFTIKKFANAMHTSEEGVERIQRARRPSIKTLLRIAMVLKMSPYDLAKYYHYDFTKIDQVMAREKNKAKQEKKNQAKQKKLASLGNYLLYCRHRNHLSQVNVSKKYKIGTATISRLENGQAKHVDIRIAGRLASAYHIPLINILKRTKLYRNLDINSPAYKIILLCQKNDLSISGFVHKSGIVSSTAYHILMSQQNHNNYITSRLQDKIIKAFHLPKNYFISNKPVKQSNNSHNNSNKGQSNKAHGYRIVNSNQRNGNNNKNKKSNNHNNFKYNQSYAHKSKPNNNNIKINQAEFERTRDRVNNLYHDISKSDNQPRQINIKLATKYTILKSQYNRLEKKVNHQGKILASTTATMSKLYKIVEAIFRSAK